MDRIEVVGDLGGPTRGKARDAPDEIRLARKPLRKGLSHLFSVGRRVNTFYNDGLLKAVDRPKNLLVEVLEGPGSSRSRKEWWRFPSFSIWEGYSAEGTGPLASSERSLAVTSTTGCPSESGLLPGWHPKPKSKSSTAGNICQMALAGREEVQVHVTVPLAPPPEYEEVLLRHRVAADWSRRETLVFFGLLLRKARRHEVYYLWRGHADDPEDAHVLEAAIATQASRLVTFTIGDFTDASQLGIEVMTPGGFLHVIK